MVTKKELYKHPKVVERILEEVEKQHDGKFEDLEFLSERLTFSCHYFGFNWSKSREDGGIWSSIFHCSNFTPFYEFWEKQEKEIEKIQAVQPLTEQPKVYTIKEVIDQKLVVNTKTLDEVKRIVKGFKSYDYYVWVEGKRSEEIIFKELKSSLCFNIENGGYSNVEFYEQSELTIIDSTQVVTNSETTGEFSGKIEKTRIDPNDLKEGDLFYNPFYSYNALKVVKGTNGDLYGIDSTGKKAFQVSLNHFGNSFTPYNIVSGGATFERPVQYPKDGELCFMDADQGGDLVDYAAVYFEESDEDQKEAFRDGLTITAEAYFKMVNEYNSKL